MGDGGRDHAGCRLDAGVDPQVHVLGEAGLARVPQLVRVAALEDPRPPRGRGQQPHEEEVDRDREVDPPDRLIPGRLVGDVAHPREERLPAAELDDARIGHGRAIVNG